MNRTRTDIGRIPTRREEWLSLLSTAFPIDAGYQITPATVTFGVEGELSVQYTLIAVSSPSSGVFLSVVTGCPHDDTFPATLDGFQSRNFLEGEHERRAQLLWRSWPTQRVGDQELEIQAVGVVAVGGPADGGRSPEYVDFFRLGESPHTLSIFARGQTGNRSMEVLAVLLEVRDAVEGKGDIITGIGNLHLWRA